MAMKSACSLLVLVLSCMPSPGVGQEAAVVAAREILLHEWAPRLDAAQAAFSRGVKFLAGGTDFSRENCLRAAPELESAMDTLHALPAGISSSGTREFAALELGYCHLAQGRDRAAIMLFRAASTSDGLGIAAEARACLAGMYAAGRGVEKDPERALGLYILSDLKGYGCRVLGTDSAHEAAELMLEMDPNAGAVFGGVIYGLLQRDKAADWLRSLQVYKRHFSGAGWGEYISIAMRGLGAPNDSEEDRAAKRVLALELGELFMRRNEPAFAYGYLRQADPVAASALLQKWQEGLPYRLILPEGVEWDLARGTLDVAAMSSKDALPDSVASADSVSGASLTVRQSPGSELLPWFNPDLLATQLTGEFADGELFPVAGGGQDWMLVVRRADVVADSANQYRLAARYGETGTILMALVTLTASDDETRKPVVRLRALTTSVADQVNATVTEAGGDDDARGTSGDVAPCIDPEQLHPSDEGLDSAGGYPDALTEFRWLSLSRQHRVLAAAVGRSEGYAGGGGDFKGEVLLDVRGARLVSVACYAVSRNQMFGGSWNPDGTREHPESQAAWSVKVQSGGEWPDLWLRPHGDGVPAAVLRWDAAAGYYLAK